MKRSDPDADLYTVFSRYMRAQNSIMKSAHEPKKSIIGTPFETLAYVSKKKVGSVGEQMAALWLHDIGYVVEKSAGTQSDRKVEGKLVEIKTSVECKAGHYNFMQIRRQRYDVLFLLGIAPPRVHIWIIPKDIIIDLWDAGVLYGFHGGKDKKDTSKIEFPVCTPRDYLEGYGGDMEAAITAAYNAFGEPRTESQMVL